MFRNSLTANDKYPVQDCEILTSSIQMILSLKPKRLIHSFVLDMKSTSNFKHFGKKDDCHSYFISEITDFERLGYSTL